MLPIKDYVTPAGGTAAFLPGAQIIADALTAAYGPVRSAIRRPERGYRGIRHYRGSGAPVCADCLYLARSSDLDDTDLTRMTTDLILIGPCELSLFPLDTTVINLPGFADPGAVYETVQGVFERLAQWDRDLMAAMDEESPLDALLETAMALLKNPIFVHDKNFFILSCPQRVPGMLVFTQDRKSRKDIAPSEIINEFKLSAEYQHTLTTHGPDMYSAEHRGYRILYINLWQDSHYLGRICMDELSSEIMPGDYSLLEHLSRYVLKIATQRNRYWLRTDKNVEQLFTELLENGTLDPGEQDGLLRYLGWSATDRYLCMKFITEQMDFAGLAWVSTCGMIESAVTASYAFIYHNSIAVVANLTQGAGDTDQVINSIAVVLRECLLKMGMSNELTGIAAVADGYRQAAIALDQGLEENSTIWRHLFRDYALDYTLDLNRRQMPAIHLAAPALITLHHYDAHHKSGLYETLRLYLENERNLVKTAKALGIHRSTLIYRLSRIQELAPVDLDDAKTRTYLKLSFLLFDPKDDSKTASFERRNP